MRRQNAILIRSAILTLAFGTACSEGDVTGLGDSGIHPDATGPAGDATTGDDVPFLPDVEVPIDAGEEMGRAVLSTETVDFGILVVGSTQTFSLTITNTGGAPVLVTIAAITGPDAERFTLNAPAGAMSIGPGQSIDVPMEVSVVAEGIITATLPLLLCEGGCPAAVTLLAEGVGSGIRCDASVDFGIVAPGACAARTTHCDNVANLVETVVNAQIQPANDPAFTITSSLALPENVGPGARISFEVSFCPTIVGDRLAGLVIDTANPVGQQVIDLRGHGGGSNITCAPLDLDFGTVGVGATVQRSLTCQNDGFEPGIIAGVMAMGPEFSTSGGPVMLDVGGFVVIDVDMTGTALGTVMGTLLITSDDPDAPEITVTLHGEVVDAQPCSAVFSPSVLDFGLVPIGVARRAAVTIDNPGTSPCLLDTVSLLTATMPGISLEAPPPAGTTIDAGSRLAINVRFTPQIAGTETATIVAGFSNPGTPPIGALINGSGGSTSLSIEPPVVDFGSVAAGCAAPLSRTITVRNTTRAPLTISAIELVASSSITLSGTPMLPATVPPLGSIELTAGFNPSIAGVYSGAVRISAGADTYVVPISGVAAGSASRTDTFNYDSPAVDILILADDSCSMAPGQAAFGEAVLELFPGLVARGADVHLGVITSDMVDPSKQGRMQGMPAVLDQNTPMFADVVAQRVQPGTVGAGVERPIDAIVAAVSAPLTMNENLGFLRPGTELAIIFFTDEDDQSMTLVADAVDSLRAAAAGGRLSMFGMAGPLTGMCNGPAGPASAAPRLAELVARADRGRLFSFCDPMSASLTAISEELFGVPSFVLSSEPRPETITVLVDGTAVPETTAAGVRLWRYDVLEQRVVFTAAGAPANGTTISISYDAFCLSPACGDGALDPFEACDDGNADDTDGCTAGCRLALCGDGFAQQGTEECDDQNVDETDDCLSTCAAASCADGFLQAGVEDCDDGNTVNGDGCPATCVFQDDVSAFYTVGPLTAAGYVPLANETPIVLTGGEDNGVGTVMLPFDFVFFGTTITSVDVSPNGYVSVNPVAGTSSPDNGTFPNNSEPSGLIAPWWEDLTIDAAIAAGASLSFEVLGSTPNRALVIQWRNARVSSHATNGHRRFNFQVALFETTNVIQYRYGETATTGGVPTATSASTGIENQDGTIGQNVLTCTPACAGPARPGNPNGFPRASQISLTPL